VNLVPANRAQPGEQGRLAAKGVQLADGQAERRLRDLFRRIFALIDARQGKPVDAGKHTLEELLERDLVALEQLFDKGFVDLGNAAHRTH
jgi:hypothetical protein